MKAIKITEATAKGRRDYQEDTKAILTLGYNQEIVAAVFDGHGGHEASTCCADKLSKLMPTTGSPEERLRELFRELAESTAAFDCGSTASVLYAPDEGTKIYVAIIGDSPVIVRKNSKDLWIAPEHNVRSNQKEADAVIERGGIVSQGYAFSDYFGPGLQMSRALGDFPLDRILSREPEIFSLDVEPGASWALVATDGILDPGHQGAGITDLITMTDKPEATAETLVQHALDIKTGDNVTAILLRF